MGSNIPNRRQRLQRQQQQQQQPQTREDIWRSGRRRFGFRQLLAQRGPDRQWHFSGQEPGENVKLVVRKHMVFLLPAALPLIGSFALLIVLLWFSTSRPALSSLWRVLFIVDGLLIVGTAFYFIWSDLLKWWFDSTIITNKRIIRSYGVLQPVREETTLDKVVQVGIDLDSPLALLLNFGNLHLYLTGGQLVIKGIPKPRFVKDVLQGVAGAVKAGKPPKEETPLPRDEEMANLLKDLKKGKPVPTLPNADEKYPPFRDPDRYNGPRRKFGWPIGVYANVHYLSGEFTVMYIQRSLYVLYNRLTLPVLGTFLALSAAAIFPAFNVGGRSFASYWWFIMGIVVFIMLIWGVIAWISYIEDVYILTNKRIIDIERHLLFFFESRAETEYKNIRDIRVKVRNVTERALDIGDVYVETPGSNPDIILRSVDHPFVIQDTIYGIKGHKEKVDKAEAENKEKEMLYDWFGRVVTSLEKKIQNQGVPNLEGRELGEAMALASEINLNVVVKSEVPKSITPGVVIQQSPPPGTIMAPGGDIQVMISRRPTPLDMI
ncbi:MAG TPA: PASTA domain-containing protein [Ktedonobacteraceae bacterium]|nr:PASTA domain-containing protein [Ktedonobacteraceae bacterium]